MRLRSYSWSPRSAEHGSEWLAIHSPLFTSPAPALVGPGGAYRMWAGGSFILSHTSCDRATLIHSPSATPAIDHFGICFLLSGTIGLLSNAIQAQALACSICTRRSSGSAAAKPTQPPSSPCGSRELGCQPHFATVQELTARS